MNNDTLGIIPVLPSFQENKVQTTELVITQGLHAVKIETGHAAFIEKWTKEKHQHRNQNAVQVLDTYMSGLKQFLLAEFEPGTTNISASQPQEFEKAYLRKDAFSGLDPLDRKMYRIAFSCFLAARHGEDEKTFKDYVGSAVETTNGHLGALVAVSHKQKSWQHKHV